MLSIIGDKHKILPMTAIQNSYYFIIRKDSTNN